MSSENPKRILILDDDVKVRTMYGFWLTEEGYHVVHAANGLEAISLHRQNPFDLIILELVLADNDAFETFAELRRMDSPPKFIATSKSNRIPAELHLKMARHLGAHRTLAKPFTAEQLVAAVRSVLALE
ncbi:MAG TPA: response regulator [Candidatus Aquilonibacter sp.]|nr:response regulator [Candidatus Aquilonibacter sp.]